MKIINETETQYKQIKQETFSVENSEQSTKENVNANEVRTGKNLSIFSDLINSSVFKSLASSLTSKEKAKALSKCVNKIKKALDIRINDSFKDADIAEELVKKYHFLKFKKI